jgi:leucyl/phenylalanyl-tRNA--protein transferase
MGGGRCNPEVRWVNPELRGILPLMGFSPSRSLRRTLRRMPYKVTVDQSFGRVIRHCAETTQIRAETWINGEIMDLYSDLYNDGKAHSVECWAGDELVGGLYGVSIGAAFFGESMFSRRVDTSKVALAHLVARLVEGAYLLLDVQFITEHLRRLGAIEISREDYLGRLGVAVSETADFYRLDSIGGKDSTSTAGCSPDSGRE